MLDIRRALEAFSPGDLTGTLRPEAAGAVEDLASGIMAYAAKGKEALGRVLADGLKAASRGTDRVSLAVTGMAWVGAGAPSVEQELMSLVRDAQREIMLCAYSVTPGALPVLTAMRQVAGQGVNVTLVVNDFSEQPGQIKDYLRDAARDLGDRWRALDFNSSIATTDLHAKVLVVDRRVALVGSANLSFHGMVSNHEMALVIRGPTAEVIAGRMDLLLRYTSPVTPVT